MVSRKRPSGQPPRAPRQSSTTIRIAGRRVGTVSGDTFRQSRRGSKHFIRHPERAIAFDVALLDQVEQAGASRVIIRDMETGTEYRAGLSFIRAAGFPIHRGHGNQVALPLANWVASGGKKKAKPQPEPQSRNNTDAAPAQLGLFEGVDR